jgi:hypothetical protein
VLKQLKIWWKDGEKVKVIVLHGDLWGNDVTMMDSSFKSGSSETSLPISFSKSTGNIS